MKVTVIEIKAMLDTLPDNMEVEFIPITPAYTGCMGALRVADINFFKDMKHSLPSVKGTTAAIYLHEES